MKNSIPYLFFFFIMAALITTGCNKEFNVNADYKDVTVVYGLLNVSDTAHYIKIYKGFLTEDNAILAASNLNNITYSDSIKVTMEEYINNVLVREILLDTTTAIPKEPGDVAYPKQILYYTNETLSQDATYKLKIKNKNTNKLTTAETKIVNDFRITSPRFDYIDLNIEGTSKIKFTKPDNASAYDLYWSFRYIEVSKATGQIVKTGVITRKLNSTFIRNSALASDGQYAFDFVPKNFYSIIASSLQVDNSVTRYTDGEFCMEILAWGGEENIITYVDLATPSSSIVQDRVEFSNIHSDDNSAVGIFSSRNSASKTYKLETIFHSEDTLVAGAATGHLGFDYYRNFASTR